MKKLLIILVIFMCLPFMVLADSAGPSILGYDAVVINKKGAKVQDSDTNKVIKYNTKIYVYNEYDNKVDACNYTGKTSCEGDTFTLSVKDIAPLKKEVVPKDLEKIKKEDTFFEKVNTKLLVDVKEGIKLKKGPADVYDKYSFIIPYKKVLTAKYAISHYIPGGLNYSWYYVDDGEYKGWIDAGFATYYTDSIMMFDDVKMLDLDTDKEIATIPVETIITGYYSGEHLYFTYNDNFGYVKGFYQIGADEYYRLYGEKSKESYILTLESIELKSKGKSISAIPKGQLIKVIYGIDDDSEHGPHSPTPVCIKENECYYYIEYNDIKGFVSDKNVIALEYGYEPAYMTTEKEYEVYDIDYYEDYDYDAKIKLDEYSKKHKKDNTIPLGAKVNVYKNTYLEEKDSNLRYHVNLVKYNSIFGWIITEIEEDINQEPTSTPTPTNNKSKSDKPSDTIIYAIIGATLASAAAIGTIIVINSKKKKNNKEVKPTNQEVPNTIEPKKQENDNNKNADK